MTPQRTWTCRDGRVLNIAEMDTKHLANTVRMLRQKGFVSTDEFDNAARSLSGMRGEYASMAAENEFASMKVNAALGPLEEELQKRATTAIP